MQNKMENNDYIENYGHQEDARQLELFKNCDKFSNALFKLYNWEKHSYDSKKSYAAHLRRMNKDVDELKKTLENWEKVALPEQVYTIEEMQTKERGSWKVIQASVDALKRDVTFQLLSSKNDKRMLRKSVSKTKDLSKEINNEIMHYGVWPEQSKSSALDWNAMSVEMKLKTKNMYARE